MRTDGAFLNRRIIGAQYLLAGVFFLTVGFLVLPWLGGRAYPQSGTIIVFFGILPVIFAGFGNLVMPLERNGPLVLARLNATGLILFYFSVIFLAVSFLKLAAGMFFVAIAFNIAAWIDCSICFIWMIPGAAKNGWMAMPFYFWSLFLTALLSLVAFLPLEFAAISESVRFFSGSEIGHLLPEGNRGVPLFWHHTFWFMGHPEVYVLMLFVLGLFAEFVRVCFKGILKNNSS